MSTGDKLTTAAIWGGATFLIGVFVLIPGLQWGVAALLPTLQASLGTVVAGVGTIQAPIIAPLMSFAASGVGTGTTALLSTAVGAIVGLFKGSDKKEKGSDKKEKG